MDGAPLRVAPWLNRQGQVATRASRGTLTGMKGKGRKGERERVRERERVCKRVCKRREIERERERQ